MALTLQYWANYVNQQTKLSRKSEAAVESGRVLRFTIDELRVINAHVQASMRDKSYKVQVFLEQENNGVVQSSSCECPMGKYKCHHVAAVLLYGYKRLSKTDVKCGWLKHPKSAPPKQTATMKELYPPKQAEYRALKREFVQEDNEFLYNELGRLGRYTALHWVLQKEPVEEDRKISVPLIEDLLLSQEYLSSEHPQTWLRQRLLVSDEKITETARLTAGQRENALWAAVRKLRFTASNFGQIIGAAKRNRLTASLKKRLLSAYNLEKRAPIQWGITYEARALEAYCKIGGVSIMQTVSNGDGHLSLKSTHDYWHQIQGQLFLTRSQCCDLIVWTPKDIQIIRVFKDPSWMVNISTMLDFYFGKFLPSLD